MCLDLGFAVFLTVASENLGIIAVLNGNLEAARHLFQECYRVARDNGDQAAVGTALLGFGLASAAEGRYRQALTELGAADALYQALGITFERFEQRLRDDAMVRCQTELGIDRVDDYRRGRDMTPTQAIAFALSRGE